MIVNRRLTTRLLLVLTGTVGFILVAFGFAWACTVQAHVSSVEPSSMAAGETVTMRGAEYRKNTTVEVHWETADGPVLATTTTDAEGNFTVSFAVPEDVTTGDYLVHAIAPALYPDAGRGVARIHVTGDEPAQEGGAQPPADQEGQPAEQPAPTGEEQAPAPADEPQAPAPVSEEQAPAPAADEPQAPAPVSEEQAPAPVSEEQAPAPVSQERAPAPKTEQVPAAAAAATAEDRPSPTVGALRADGRLASDAAPAASEASRSAVAELRAFDAANRDPSLITGVPAESVRQMPVGLGTGFGVLAVGLVVLFAGFTAALVVTRRQRVEREE